MKITQRQAQTLYRSVSMSRHLGGRLFLNNYEMLSDHEMLDLETRLMALAFGGDFDTPQHDREVEISDQN